LGGKTLWKHPSKVGKLPTRNEKEPNFVGWEALVAILVYQGLKVLLPEIKEWIKIGALKIVLKRQEIKKRLIEYAKEKELSFPEAEQTASVIAEKISEENIEGIVRELEIGKG
jgi:hypothetical protein